MDHQHILKDKRILLVDDEPDILETLEELLYYCKTDSASTFESAVLCLKNNTYDAAILDIMGVRGYSLLKITHKLDIPAIMLTAHALTPLTLQRDGHNKLSPFSIVGLEYKPPPHILKQHHNAGKP